MKYRASIKLRCKDCYVVTRSGQKRVECRTSPRHKSAQGKAKRK
jgi:large subunit ribosomal protein L36